MEQKTGYRFPPWPRLSYWTHWKIVCSVWENLRHHSLCSEPVMSHLPLLLIPATANIYQPCKLKISLFKCTGQPVGSTEIQIWHITYKSTFVLLIFAYCSVLLIAAKHISWKSWCCSKSVWICRFKGYFWLWFNLPVTVIWPSLQNSCSLCRESGKEPR